MGFWSRKKKIVDNNANTESLPVECEKLEHALRNYGLYESPEETAKREEVLNQLDQIVKQWIVQVSMEQVSFLVICCVDGG